MQRPQWSAPGTQALHVAFPGVTPNGEWADLPSTVKACPMGLGVAMIRVRLKQTPGQKQRLGTAWTRLLDAAPGPLTPHSSVPTGPCAAGGGKSQGQVSRPAASPGPELLSHHLGAQLSLGPLPWTPEERSGPYSTVVGRPGGQWGCTLPGGGSCPSVPQSGVWAEFPPHPRTDAHLAAAHQLQGGWLWLRTCISLFSG